MSWTTTTDLLAANLPNYESRVQQDNLALQVERVLADGGHLLGQAGCGIGKSFAYLSAAYDYARRTRRPVVVATATKALQNQLGERDLPFLASLFPDLKFAVVKGRSNYACLQKVHGEDGLRVGNIEAIRRELDERGEWSGEVDELLTPIRPADKPNLVSGGDECPGKSECPFGDVCLSEAAKARAMEADIVVANHALVIADIVVRNATAGKAGMLPHAGAYVIDEAHELEDYTTGALGEEITQRGLETFAEAAVRYTKKPEIGDGLKDAAEELFTILGRRFPEGSRESTLRIDEDMLAEVLGEPVIVVYDEVVKIVNQIESVRAVGEEQSTAKKRITRRARSLAGRFARIVGDDFADLVRWVEKEDRTFRGKDETRIKLCYAPLHVGQFLADTIWSKTPAVLVSATLATDAKFDYISGRLGLDLIETPPVGFDAGSPFDFAKQSALYIPGADYPAPAPGTKDRWETRTISEIRELVKASGGRALLLFTSRAMMNKAYAELLPTLKTMGVTALRQGDGRPNELVERFTNDETSVLFGLRSFMTGVDFQGDTCRLVVIDKMPFTVPSDVVFAARGKAIDEANVNGVWHKGQFMLLQIPSASLVLQQAFGRAIRTKADTALVAIFDPRLRTKSYGAGVLRSLPPAARVDNLRSARAFLEDLSLRETDGVYVP